MLINAGFWMSFCLVTTYAAVFLQGIGFSNSELGIIAALGNVGSALLSTFLGSLIDRNPRVRHVSVLNGLAAAQAPSYALFIAMSTPYAGQAVAAKDSAKAQSLLASAAYVGCVAAGLAGGVMFDTFGVRTTMLIAAAIAALGAGIAWAGVAEKKAEAGFSPK